MKIGNVEFQGSVVVNGVSFSLERLQQMLTDSTMWMPSWPYSKGSFVSHLGKCYISLADGNVGNPPTDRSRWEPYGGGGMTTEAVYADGDAEVGVRHLCMSEKGVSMRLPKGSNGDCVGLSAQRLSPGGKVSAVPFEGDTVAGSSSLEIDVPYGSVELVFIDGDWRAVSPMLPFMTMLQTGSSPSPSNGVSMPTALTGAAVVVKPIDGHYEWRAEGVCEMSFSGWPTVGDRSCVVYVTAMAGSSVSLAGKATLTGSISPGMESRCVVRSHNGKIRVSVTDAVPV